MSQQPKSIVEVARAAGVSTATVSRVMNGLPGVRAETVAQVRAAMLDLKYIRQRTRSTRRRSAPRPPKLRTGSIAVTTVGHGQSWLQMPVLASVLGGIQRGASSADLRLILSEMPDATKPSQILVDRQVDGAVVFLSSDVPVADYESIFSMMQAYTPVVWAMGIGSAVGGVDHVAPDNVGIGHMAYKSLRDMGCKRFAYLTTTPGWPLMRLRGQSFLNSAIDEGHQPTVYAVAGSDEDRLVEPYGRRVVVADRLEETVRKFAESDPRPDGLFIGRDFTTANVYPLLAQHGLVVGRDLQIISCDAEEARLAGLHPRPASIDLGGEEIGYRCVARLLNRIERPNGPPLIIQVAPRLRLPPGAA
ncbi:MAG TPA: LacI family DNA-binding transcriptional regulator [Tepidisphaeraceae bacterium]|jgi:LacI family transcriptional regulator